MEMNLEIKKRQAYFVIGILIIVLVAVVVNASVNKAQAWHSGNQIEVSIAGSTKSLQEAINNGDFVDTFSAGLSCAIAYGTIPDYGGERGAEITVDCPAGYIVTGGGAHFISSDKGPDLRTEPIKDSEGKLTKWTCVQSESMGGECYAICCKIN